jgi:hypothetical protein
VTRDEPYARIRALLARVAVPYARVGFRAATAFGVLRYRMTRRWPSVAEVRALFPHLESRAASHTAARISALEERNRVLVRMLRGGGIDAVHSFSAVAESLAAFHGPAVLATFHTGAVFAIGPVLSRLQSPVLAFRGGQQFTPYDSLQTESTRGDEQQRAAALHRALQHLRLGGLVAIALDAVPDRGIETRCLGRSLRLAPGAFALARWAHAPVIPLVARWTPSGIRVETGDSLDAPQEAATWLERYLLSSPSETTLGLLRTLLAAS